MLKKYFHIIILSLAIVLLNLWPSFFLLPGTYFLLDTGFTPFTEFKAFFDANFYKFFIDLGNLIFGYALWSKIYFLLTLLTGIVVGILVSKNIGNLFPEYKGRVLDTISIMICVYNPFIYERIISQTGIALGAYMLMIGSLFLIDLSLERRGYRPLIISSVLLGIGWMIFPHAILLIALILGVFSCVYYRNILKYILVGFGVLLLNLNWLVGDLYLQTKERVSKIDTFNTTNIEVFQGNSLSGLGVDITHLLGYGFWGERYHVISPDALIPFWYIFAMIILLIAVYGGYKLFRKDFRIAITLFSIACISYVLALGIASPVFGDFNQYLYDTIPYYIGMREPQKWLALTIFTYIMLFSIGSLSLLQKIKHREAKDYAVFLIMLLPVLWTPASVIGYFGQLGISDYPDEIFESKDFLLGQIGENTDKNILHFPWHSYMACDWTLQTITSNRSSDLYSPLQIINSDNIEIAHLYSNSTDKVSKDIDLFLQSRKLSLLEKNNIGYILFYKTCADSASYEFLDASPDIYAKVFEGDYVNIYKIQYEK